MNDVCWDPLYPCMSHQVTEEGCTCAPPPPPPHPPPAAPLFQFQVPKMKNQVDLISRSFLQNSRSTSEISPICLCCHPKNCHSKFAFQQVMDAFCTLQNITFLHYFIFLWREELWLEEECILGGKRLASIVLLRVSIVLSFYSAFESR